MIRAVLWDFGGVILTSPFEAFERYELEAGLEPGFIRRINSTNPDANAWARLERGELDLIAFSAAFEDEARALGALRRKAAISAAPYCRSATPKRTTSALSQKNESRASTSLAIRAAS